MRGVWLLLLLTGWCSAQQGEYVLAGTVVNSKTGEPVKRAVVLLDRAGPPAGDAARLRVDAPDTGAPARTATDASGAFRFGGLRTGDYLVVVQKPHFFGIGMEEPIHLEDRDKDGVRIELTPLGTIEGTVTDQHGQPVS